MNGTLLLEPGPGRDRPRDVARLRDVLTQRWAPGEVYDEAERIRLTNAGVPPAAESWDYMQLTYPPRITMLWCSPDLMALVVKVANTVPDEIVFDPDLVPWTRGLVVFGHTIEGVDSHNGEDSTPIDGIMWGPLRMRQANGRVALAISSYCCTHEQTPGAWVPLGRSEWLAGEKVTELEGYDHRGGGNDHYAESAIEDRRLIVALWQLIDADRAVEMTEWSPAPKKARRGAATGPVPRVVVCNLHGRHRPAEGPSGGDGADGSRFHHRWWVESHPRWQAYGPERSLRKLIVVPGHMKGPEGAPLLQRDRVWKMTP